jgi:hypothetical protein
MFPIRMARRCSQTAVSAKFSWLALALAGVTIAP